MPRPTSRYTVRRATEEIEEQLRVRGRGSRKEVALAIGLDEAAFSHKMRGLKTRFSVEEIGRIASHWNAPIGWPWLPWQLGEVIDRMLSGREGAPR
jgi:hypothetical protein